MAQLPVISLFIIEHKKVRQLVLRFPYNTDLITILRGIEGAKWSKTLRAWYLKYSPTNETVIHEAFNGIAQLDTSQLFDAAAEKPAAFPVKRNRTLGPEQRQLLNGFYKYLVGKRYSKSTIDTYLYFVADFIEFQSGRDLTTLTVRDVELFIESVFIKRKYSVSTQRQFISAIKQFSRFYPNTEISDLELTRPRKSRILPTVLSQEEMLLIISYTKNLKHRAVLALIYSCGLRISELIQLKLEHINIQRKQVFIRTAKGRKDRYVTLADSFLPLLHNYLITYRPEVYFVEGSKGGMYSASSVRKFLTKSCKAAHIKRHVTPHTLRHSYATHLIENGVGLRHIQELLGHAKPETTMIYTHVARKDLLEIKSPLDLAITHLRTTDKAEQNFLLS
ncbi:tyrosine-type recombinase/integrase [Bizionia paragorgiae]|uniref:Site-specific recombinase XerD n=1 Tax=Bizionia paragorgiae TaxID=283786 RepID=A0A1H4BSY9_BIZPA|nr:site-specific integrase [Bizionia paragorgiae]SEA51229.1 Site-specific recombinase XerD [Bizionia paragorgiae]